MNASGFVYFIRPVGMPGPIKVGYSDKPIKRVHDLMTWSPVDLEIIGTVGGTLQDEEYLHSFISDLHIRREWFRVEPRLTEIMNAVLGAGSVRAGCEGRTRVGKLKKRDYGFTESQRLQRSYSARVRAVQRRRWASGDRDWRVPQYVDDIFRSWQSCHDADRSSFPEIADLARLDQFLADAS